MRKILLAAGLLAASLPISLPAAAQRPGALPPGPPEAERLTQGGRQGFVVDPANGCWLWLSGLPPEVENVAVSWTGPCPQGPAEGEGRATFTWREGSRSREMIYDGEVQHGRSVGRGRQAHMLDGEPILLQQGRYVDDYLAEGRMELLREGIIYEGRFAGTRPDGPGKLTLRGRSFEGTWRQGCLEVAPGAWIALGRPPESCVTQDS